MPVASNPLLQASIASKPSRVPVSVMDKAPQATSDKASGFSDVYARQAEDKAVAPKPAANSGKAEQDDASKVADSGNDLPEEVVAEDTTQTADNTDAQVLDQSLVAGQVTDAQPGAQLIQAQAEAVAPVVQAAAQLQAQVPPTPAPAVPPAVVEEVPFDPAADVLADLPAVRLALEHTAQAQGTTSAHAANKNTPPQPEVPQGQASVNTLAPMLDPADADAGKGEPGDKAFAGLIDDGLKDLKSASSDTRVDNFAERLGALTQAATAKTANAVPVVPLNQPLAMHQSGWTEGLVNRVMYLSSQNLKSADIQLEPRELGRLDIRVNLAPEQQAQITFVSGHAGVREALEGQVHRLRDLFAQQGLAQPDVNVADQSRGQQQQAQQQGQQEGSRLSGVAARRNEAGGVADGGTDAVAAQPVEQSVVVGSSVVDYYA